MNFLKLTIVFTFLSINLLAQKDRIKTDTEVTYYGDKHEKTYINDKLYSIKTSNQKDTSNLYIKYFDTSDILNNNYYDEVDRLHYEFFEHIKKQTFYNNRLIREEISATSEESLTIPKVNITKFTHYFNGKPKQSITYKYDNITGIREEDILEGTMNIFDTTGAHLIQDYFENNALVSSTFFDNDSVPMFYYQFEKHDSIKIKFYKPILYDLDGNILDIENKNIKQKEINLYDKNKQLKFTSKEINLGQKMEKYYYENGNKMIEIPYLTNKKNGTVNFYDKSGNLIQKIPFTNDIIHGKIQKFNSLGELINESIYLNGVKDGDETILFDYTKNIIPFSKGLIEGKRQFFAGDIKISELPYNKGMLNGTYILPFVLYKDSSVTGTFLNNKINGTITSKFSKFSFLNGEIIEHAYFGINNSLEKYYIKDNFYIKEHYFEGELNEITPYFVNEKNRSLIHGTKLEYFKGEISYETDFEYGLKKEKRSYSSNFQNKSYLRTRIVYNDRKTTTYEYNDNGELEKIDGKYTEEYLKIEKQRKRQQFAKDFIAVAQGAALITQQQLALNNLKTNPTPQNINNYFQVISNSITNPKDVAINKNMNVLNSTNQNNSSGLTSISQVALDYNKQIDTRMQNSNKPSNLYTQTLPSQDYSTQNQQNQQNQPTSTNNQTLSPTKTTGNYIFWTDSPNFIGLEVTILNDSKQITNYYSSSFPSCSSVGCANFELTPGTYHYIAVKGTYKWEGNITIYSNQCNLKKLSIQNPNNTITTTNQINTTLWIKNDLKMGSIYITINGQTEEIDRYYNSQPKCNSVGCANFKLAPDQTYHFKAESKSGKSWTGTFNVLNNTCNVIEVAEPISSTYISNNTSTNNSGNDPSINADMNLTSNNSSNNNINTISSNSSNSSNKGSMGTGQGIPNLKKGIWGDWQTLSCFKGIQFRVSIEYYNEYEKKYHWNVQFINLYENQVSFSYSAKESNIQFAKTEGLIHILPGKKSDTISLLINDVNRINIFVDQVYFGEKYTNNFSGCDEDIK